MAVPAVDHAARPVNPERLRAILKHAGRSVLDVGCGNGSYVLALKDRYEIRGVDHRRYDEWGKAPELFQVSSGEKLPFADASYDTVVSFEVLEHLADPLAALKEYRRVCRKNVIVTVPNCDVTKGMMKSNLVYSHWVDRTHVQHFERSSIVSLMEQAGFASVHAGPINRISFAPVLAEKMGLAPDGFVARGLRKASSWSPLKRYYLTWLAVGQKDAA
jgi:SAM-dependent methyltransferase